MALPVVCILGRGLSASAARCLREGYRGCGSTVCPQASYEVPDIAEAMTFQDIGGEIASQSDTAEEPYRLAGWYLAQPLPHIVEWDVYGSRYGTCRAGDEDTLAAQLLLYLSHIHLNLVARQQVLDVYRMQLLVGQ